ncbi:MAG: hypothetical protein AAGA36_11080 [Pseudomonadota bacterium]
MPIGRLFTMPLKQPSLICDRRSALLGLLSVAVAPQALADVIESKVFEGSRQPGALKGEGGEGLRARSGQEIIDCQFRALGNGAVRIDRPTDRLRIDSCEAQDLYRFLENTAATGRDDASLRDFVVTGVVARGLVRGFSRVRYASKAGLFEDIIAEGAARTANYCVGFALDDAASDITYRRCVARDFRETERADESYWNGDGFSDERGNKGIRYIQCVASGCSDGGFDTKSQDVSLERCVAQDNKRNFRLWNSGALKACHSTNPKRYGGSGAPAHIALMGDAPRYVIEDLVVTAQPDNASPVFYCETKRPAIIEIRNARIDAPAAALIKAVGPKPSLRWVGGRASHAVHVAAEESPNQ